MYTLSLDPWFDLNGLPLSKTTTFCNITLPPSFMSCTGNSVPQKLSTPAYPTPNTLPQFEYSASCMAIAKTMPPRPISDFLLNIILPSCPGHSVPQRLSTAAYPTQNRLPQFEYSVSWMAIAKTMSPWPILYFLPNIILPSHTGHSVPPRPLTWEWTAHTSVSWCLLVTSLMPFADGKSLAFALEKELSKTFSWTCNHVQGHHLLYVTHCPVAHELTFHQVECLCYERHQ